MSTIKQRIEQDLKTALLAGDKELVSNLKTLKSAILYEEVAQNLRDSGLSDEATTKVLQKEAKKRQDSADLYEKGGNNERRDQELAEKSIIQTYLPAEMTDDELDKLVTTTIASDGPLTPQNMGIIIGKVKQATAGKADGGRIAMAVKKRLA